MKNNMKRIFIMCICYFLLTACVYGETYEWEIAPMGYDWTIRGDSEGLFLVSEDGKYGYVNIKGNLVIPLIYDSAGSFSDGLARVMKDGRRLYIDKTGKEIFSTNYKWTYDFSEGLVFVKNDKGEYGFLNKKGEIAIPFRKLENEYDTYDFKEGLSRVKRNGKYGFMDKTGKIVIPCIYTNVGNFSEGVAYVDTKKGRGYIDKNGKVIIPCSYFGGADCSEGMIQILAGNRRDFRPTKYFDKSGKLVIPSIYDYGENFSEGMAVIGTEGKYYVIDKKGKKILTINGYDEVYTGFKAGVLVVEKNNKFGCIDKSGKEVIPCIYEQINSFDENGIAGAIRDGKAWVIKSPYAK